MSSTDIFAPKMADLKLGPEPPNIVKLDFGVANGRSELKSEAPGSRDFLFCVENDRSELKSGSIESPDIAFLH